MTYFGIDFEFPNKVEGRKIGVTAESSGVGWTYELYIDGYSMEKLNQKRYFLLLYFYRANLTVLAPTTAVVQDEKDRRGTIGDVEDDDEDEEEEDEV